jgi:hypothetical protein
MAERLELHANPRQAERLEEAVAFYAGAHDLGDVDELERERLGDGIILGRELGVDAVGEEDPVVFVLANEVGVLPLEGARRYLLEGIK